MRQRKRHGTRHRQDLRPGSRGAIVLHLKQCRHGEESRQGPGLGRGFKGDRGKWRNRDDPRRQGEGTSREGAHELRDKGRRRGRTGHNLVDEVLDTEVSDGDILVKEILPTPAAQSRTWVRGHRLQYDKGLRYINKTGGVGGKGGGGHRGSLGEEASLFRV